MRILGIIAEYNPMHAGHAAHIQKAKAQACADAVVVCLTPCVTQRGSFATLPVDTRVRMALCSGADAVIAFPALYACRPAQAYAMAGVSLLSGIGCDCLGFGAECGDLPLLRETALAWNETFSSCHADVQRRMMDGTSFAAASLSILSQQDVRYAPVLSRPNNILALSYLQAMEAIHSSMEPVLIHRPGDYHADAGSADPSATALRSACHRGDWPAVRAMQTPVLFSLLQEAVLHGHLLSTDESSLLILGLLRSLSADAFSDLPDLSEGIEHRLQKELRNALSMDELLSRCVTRRYPASRFRRMCMQAALGITENKVDTQLLPGTALLLGYRKESRNVLGQLGNSRISFTSRAADMEDAVRTVETRAWSLHGLLCHDASQVFLSHSVISVGP